MQTSSTNRNDFNSEGGGLERKMSKQSFTKYTDNSIPTLPTIASK